jgi:hypothetical protein
MFSLQDFPIGSYLYWIRRVSYNQLDQVVYTRYQVTEYNENGDLLTDIYPENLDTQLTEAGMQRIKKNSGGFTIVHSKDKYLYPNSRDIIVPEMAFHMIHAPELVPEGCPLTELQKILGLGLAEADELIKQATISFEKWNENKQVKTVIKLFKRKVMDQLAVGGEAILNSNRIKMANNSNDPPYQDDN